MKKKGDCWIHKIWKELCKTHGFWRTICHLFWEQVGGGGKSYFHPIAIFWKKKQKLKERWEDKHRKQYIAADCYPDKICGISYDRLASSSKEVTILLLVAYCNTMYIKCRMNSQLILHTPIAWADFNIPTAINNIFSLQYQNIDRTGSENAENHQLWNHYVILDTTIFVNYICMYTVCCVHIKVAQNSFQHYPRHILMVHY